jgi:predicted RNA binding protein YcfA (HicA-like mRNA interferase family)
VTRTSWTSAIPMRIRATRSRLSRSRYSCSPLRQHVVAAHHRRRSRSLVVSVGRSQSLARRALTKPSGRFTISKVTWAEVIRKLKAAGFLEVRSGKGSHVLLKHPVTGKEVWVAVHTKKDAGRLGNRLLREAGVE